MENKKINILILSVGRRVELVKLFQKAKNNLKIEGNIIGADMNLDVPAMYFVDKKYRISKISSEKYINELIELCNEEKIDLIIPTIDTELITLAKNKKKIEEETKAKINISEYSFIDICRDKYKTQNFLQDHKFGVPKLISMEDIENKNYKLPLFIKPLDGSSSINAFKINTEKELKFFKEYIKNPIIQEYVDGEEFTVDIFCDFESNPISIVPRKRLATRAGEISKGLIIKDKEIIEEIKRLLNVFKAKGHITVQCMKNKNGVKYIEINPRFGGGAPMSIMAGANSPEYLYKLILGEKLKYTEDYQDEFLVLRYDEAVYISKNKVVIKNV